MFLRRRVLNPDLPMPCPCSLSGLSDLLAINDVLGATLGVQLGFSESQDEDYEKIMAELSAEQQEDMHTATLTIQRHWRFDSPPPSLPLSADAPLSSPWALANGALRVTWGNSRVDDHAPPGVQGIFWPRRALVARARAYR